MSNNLSLNEATDVAVYHSSGACQKWMKPEGDVQKCNFNQILTVSQKQDSWERQLLWNSNIKSSKASFVMSLKAICVIHVPRWQLLNIFGMDRTTHHRFHKQAIFKKYQPSVKTLLKLCFKKKYQYN